MGTSNRRDGVVSFEDGSRRRFSIPALRKGFWLCALLLLPRLAGAAALQVLTPRVIGDNAAVPHYTYGGAVTALKAVVTGGTTPYAVQWDYTGSGTFDASPGGLNQQNDGVCCDITVFHTYADPTNTITYSSTVKITDNNGLGTSVYATYKIRVFPSASVTDSIKTDIAVDDGLWFCHRNLKRTTSAGGQPLARANSNPTTDNGYDFAGTAVIVQAMQSKTHWAGGDAADPYTADVQAMHNYLFSDLVTYAISDATIEANDPDPTNINASGMKPASNIGDDFYTSGMVLASLGTSDVPNQVVGNVGGPCVGKTYKWVCQELIDYIAFSQTPATGGWRYTPRTAGALDGSQHTWIASALYWTQTKMGCYVRPALITGLNNAINALLYQGSTGYSGANSWANVAKTAGNLGSMHFCGDTAGPDPGDGNGPAQGGAGESARVTAARLWTGNHWGDNSSQYGNFGDFYAMYATMKGARAYSPVIQYFQDTGGTKHFWYTDYRTWLLAHRDSTNTIANGQIHGSSSMWPLYDSYPVLITAMGVEILELAFMTSPPVAVGFADSTNVAPNSTVTVHHNESYHLDPTKSIVQYQWDFGKNLGGGVYDGVPDGTYDFTTTDPNAIVTFKVGGVGTYHTVLLVTDNSTPTPQTATDSSVVISVTNTNHAPVSVPVPPGTGYTIADYIFDVMDATLTLDGTHSYDPDVGDVIQSYRWTLPTGQVFGATQTVNPKPAAWSPGNTYTVVLDVEDTNGPLWGTAGAQVYVSADSRPTATSQTVNLNEYTTQAITLTGTSLRVPKPMTATITGVLPANGVLYQSDGTTVIGATPTVVTDPAMKVVYTPNPGWFGADSLTFTVNDGVKTSAAAATVTINVASVPSPYITIVAGNPQNFPVNTAFGTQLQVQVFDGGGVPQVGKTVTFTAPAAGASGTFAGGVNTAVTIAGGFATAPAFTANTVAGGPYVVTATVLTYTPNPVSFHLTNNPGAAAQLVITTQPSNIVDVNQIFPQQPVIWITDLFGNLCAPTDPKSNDHVTAARAGGSGNLLGTTTVQAVNGVASFANAGLNCDTVGTITIQFTDADNPVLPAPVTSENVTINKITATVMLSNLNQTYDGINQKLATVTTNPVGKTVVVTYNPVPATPTNAGSYAVGAVINDTYYQGSAQDILVVAPVPLTVTAGNKSRVYNTANPAFTYSYSGFVNGETEVTAPVSPTPTLTTAAGLLSPVGLYQIIPSGAVATNYSFIYVPGTLTINPAVAITGAPGGSISEGTPVNLGVTIGDPTATSFTYLWSVSASNNQVVAAGNANTYSFTPNDNGTYVVTLNVTDNTGFSNTDSKTITVTNANPSAAIAITLPAAPPYNEGTAITVTGTATDPGSVDTFTYAWNVTKGGNPFSSATNGPGMGNTNTYTFTPDTAGNYVVSLTITDKDGGSSAPPTTKLINVVAVNPAVAITNAPASSPEGTAISLGSTVTPAANTADTFTYAWSVLKTNTDGFNNFLFASGTNSTITFTPDDEGTYTATLTVTSSSVPGANNATATIIVTTVAPIVAITGAPTSGAEGTAINLGSTVTYPAGTTHAPTYSWSVVADNGQVFPSPAGTLAAFTFTPRDNGKYVVTLTVTDDDVQSGTDSKTINITNVPPTAAITVAPGLNVNEGTLITATGTITDPGTVDTFTCAWSVTLNGNNYLSATHGPVNQAVLPNPTTDTFNFTAFNTGTYVVSLTVTDKDGGVGLAPVQTITVNNVAPTAAIAITLPAAPPYNEGTAITVTGTAGDPGSPADTFTYAWSVTKGVIPFSSATNGPGLPATNNYTFTPDTAGVYTVSLTITDKDGGSSAPPTTQLITVVAVNPAVAITNSPPSGKSPEGTPINLGCTVTPAANTADTFTYAWLVVKTHDGVPTNPFATGTNPGFTFTPDDEGTYVVTLTVTTSSLGTATDTRTITATTVSPTVAITNAPAFSTEGSTFSLGCTITDPVAVAHTFTYLWNVTAPPGQVIAPSGTTPPFSFTAEVAGIYTVTLTVTDDDGSSGSDSKTISVANVAPAVQITGLPASSPAGKALTVTGVVTDPGAPPTGVDNYTYSWTVSKNGSNFVTVSHGPGDPPTDNLTFKPDSQGTYQVGLTVTDKDGGVGVAATQTVDVTIVPVTLVVDGAPPSSPEGTPINLTSTVTEPPGNESDTFTYAWNITMDGNPYARSTTPNYTLIPNEDGDYTVTLTVISSSGGTATVTKTIHVAVVPPTVAINGAPASALEGDQINLTSTVTAPVAHFYLYTWTVTASNGRVVPKGNSTTYSFAATGPGTYVVSLTVTDEDNGTGTDTKTITVINVPPTVQIINAPTTSLEGTKITLGTVVSDPGTGEIMTYNWSVTKDGAPYASGNAATMIFTPNDNATYVATVTVNDGNGGTGTDTVTIPVLNVQPMPTIIVPDGLKPEGSPITVSAVVTDPGSVDTQAYAWRVTRDGLDFANETHGPGLGDSDTFTFTPEDCSNYIVALTVTDKDGGSGLAPPQIIQVAVVPPVVAINGAPASSPEGTALTLTSTVTDPGTMETFMYNWSVQKDGQPYTSGTAASLPFTPAHAGTYVVNLTVTSRGGGAGTAAVTINVFGVGPLITSGPTVNFNPLVIGQTGLFFCSAADVDPVTWTWNFGDGTTNNNNWNTLIHTYTAVGTYTVTVTATDTKGLSTTKTLIVNAVLPGTETDSTGDGVPDPIKAAVGVVLDDPNNPPLSLVSSPGTKQNLTVLQLGIKLFFNLQIEDEITLSGTVPTPTGWNPAGQKVVVDVGGNARVFTLNSKGAAKQPNPSNTGMDWIKTSNKKGKLVFSMSWDDGGFAANLNAAGLVKAQVSTRPIVIVSVLLNKTLYQNPLTIRYVNRTGMLGVGKGPVSTH